MITFTDMFCGEDDFDRDDMLRYNAYAAECQAVLGRFRNIIAGQE
jgi:hypothetical protein